MHILDFLMYFPIMGFIWWLIGKLSNGELTNELGALIGIIIILICTIIYVILFTWYPDLNWIDIFRGVSKLSLPNIVW